MPFHLNWSLAAWISDAFVWAFLWSSSLALAVVGIRQPARRIYLTRLALFGLLSVWLIVLLLPGERHLACAALIHFRRILDLVCPRPTLRLIDTVGLGGFLHSDETAIPDGLILLYAAVLTIQLGWVGLGWFCACRFVKNSRWPRPSTLALYRELTQKARFSPQLRVSRNVECPVLFGVIRGTILIPPELEEPLEVERLRLGLRHELAHAERRDAFFVLLASLAQAFWFMLPQVWWLGHLLRVDQEYLADRRTGDGLAWTYNKYARVLVDEADDRSHEPGQPSSVLWTARGPSSPLVNRVLMLVACPFPVEGRPPVWWRWGVAIATVAVMTSGLHLLEPAQDIVMRRTSTAQDASSTFRVPWLSWTSHHDSQVSGMRVLPIVLPTEFDLSLEIRCRPVDLARYAFANYHVAPRCPEADERDVGFEPPWLHVRLRQEAGRSICAWVDDAVASVRSRRGPSSNRLVIEAPEGRLVEIRGLVLKRNTQNNPFKRTAISAASAATPTDSPSSPQKQNVVFGL